ncbi:MAG TPA: lysozyme inhibitor LprI family protein [Blastocatellia bacterium]|nr:lysozyme inhibitor LprI family protein [Blastocatellia bacterium]
MMKITFMTVAAFCLLLTLGGAASAQAKKDPCDNAQTQAEMNDCQAREYKKADAALNTVYKQLMTKIDDEGERTALKNAQLAWLKFRDSDCEFEAYQNKGGTIYPLIYDGCLTTLTRARAKQLNDMLHDR